MAPVVLSVKLEPVSVFESDLGIALNRLAGLVEDAVGTHLGGKEFLSNEIGTGAGEAKDSRPHGQAAGGRDLLAGRQDNLLGFLVSIGCLFFLAAQGAQSHTSKQGRKDLSRDGVLRKTTIEEKDPRKGWGLFETGSLAKTEYRGLSQHNGAIKWFCFQINSKQKSVVECRGLSFLSLPKMYA